MATRSKSKAPTPSADEAQQMRLTFAPVDNSSRIISVNFRSSIAGPAAYQHQHVEVKASVALGDDPSKVLDTCKLFVAQELHRARFGKTLQPEPAAMSFEDVFKQVQRRRP